MQCFLVFINTAETKEEIINLIYIFRYYNLLPFDENKAIYENRQIQKNLKQVKEELIRKAIDYKVMLSISNNIKENVKLLQFVFQTRIISLEDIYISVRKEKDKYSIELSEDNEDSHEEKNEIKDLKKENLNIKVNKKIKLLS